MSSGFADIWIWYIGAAICVFDGLFLGWLAKQGPQPDAMASLTADSQANPGKGRRAEGGVLRLIANVQFVLAAAAFCAGLYLQFG